MIKVIEIRKIIVSALESAHPRVYYRKAPKKIEDPDNPGSYIPTPFPYLVYDLPNSNDDGTLEQFILDVDAWDMSDGDTTTVEILIDSADKSLHRKTFTVDDNLSVTFYRDNRLTVEDDDPSIKRRKYIYEVRTFERRI